jgi:hypothetical protein
MRETFCSDLVERVFMDKNGRRRSGIDCTVLRTDKR